MEGVVHFDRVARGPAQFGQALGRAGVLLGPFQISTHRSPVLQNQRLTVAGSELCAVSQVSDKAPVRISGPKRNQAGLRGDPAADQKDT